MVQYQRKMSCHGQKLVKSRWANRCYSPIQILYTVIETVAGHAQVQGCGLHCASPFSLTKKNTKVLLHLPRPAGCSDVMWCCDVMSRYHMMSRRHAMTSHHTIDRCLVSVHSNQKTLEMTFFLPWWPWPLTYELDHQTHPRYSQGTFLHQILGL